jgi:glutamate/tyrosine decarboxylase-like PLP-dependent enzyme
MSECRQVSAWFAGPSGENSEQFAGYLRNVYEDYVYWRRNYYPTDGVVVDTHSRRDCEPFWDDFTDRLTELLGRLKADYPFHSPRYAAHMIAEQTLPSIAGMFAGLLYNPNNVSSEAAPVTVRMELEVADWLCRMLGYGDQSWGHITSGGTIANIEALWAARSTLFLPLVVRDVARSLKLEVPESGLPDRELLALSPSRSLQALQDCFSIAASKGVLARDVIAALGDSEYNVVERGLGPVLKRLDTELVVLAPETCHYCIPKALDVLGLGRETIEYVPVDRQFRMRSQELASVVDRVGHGGRTILAVVGVAGTTEEGAIDPIHEIVAVRDANAAAGGQSFWIHADAAYGGYLRTMIVPHRIGLGDPHAEVVVDGKKVDLELYLPYGSACDALESLGECDSIAIDPHKLGYVPYPAGAVCFKSDLVKPVLRQDAPYIAGEAQSPSLERRSQDVGVFVLEGSKPGMVAAALWMSHGLIPLDCEGHGRLMQETVRNCGELYTLLRDYPTLARGIKVQAVPLCEPNSNIVCYAFVPIGRAAPLEEVNRANEAVHDTFKLGRDGTSAPFYVSRTVLRPERYRWATVSDFIGRIGGTEGEYGREGVFLLRSVLMNPWYSIAKSKGRYFLSEYVEALYERASSVYGG